MSSMLLCPLCSDKDLIRVPSNFNGSLCSLFQGLSQAIDEYKIHRVAGGNCWNNGIQAYRGHRTTTQGANGSGRRWVSVYTPSGQPLSPQNSQNLINHSPDGFEWGYPGLGPSQLALAILLHHTQEEVFSLKCYQLFKEAFVVHWENTWQITCQQLDTFYDNAADWWDIQQEIRDGQMEQACKGRQQDA